MISGMLKANIFFIIATLAAFSIVMPNYIFGQRPTQQVISAPVNALEQCKTVDKFVDFQSLNLSSPSGVQFIVYANVTHLFHLSFDAKIRVGIPGDLGYKCTFFHDDQNPKLVEYQFPTGSIIPKQEFFVCVDNLETREDNCETHRYTLKKNPEVIDLRLRNID
jgi:hypothetical protein